MTTSDLLAQLRFPPRGAASLANLRGLGPQSRAGKPPNDDLSLNPLQDAGLKISRGRQRASCNHYHVRSVTAGKPAPRAR
jgi:hypothetical protein